MNTSPTTPKKQLPPFAAVVHFKHNCLYQQKHPSWTFRSDWVSPLNTPIHKQFLYLESHILKELKGQYITASIFNNCGQITIPYGEELPKNNLVLYIDHDQIKVDHRKYIDLSFLEHTYDKTFLEFLAVSFEQQKYEIDLKASILSGYAKEYKENILNK